MRVLEACSLVMHAMHQPLPIVKALPLSELFIWARMAALMTGREFD